MRYLGLLAVLLLLPITADAQQQNRRGSGDRRSDRGADNRRGDDRRSDQRNSGNGHIPANDHRQTNTNSTSFLMPLGLPPVQTSPPAWQVGPTMLDLQRQRNDNRYYKHRPGNGYIYVAPGYGYFPYTLPGVTEAYVTPPAPTEVVVPRAVEPPPPPPPAPPIGVLRLEVEPRNLLQIFVDGVYVGTPADVGDEIGLSPGVRHIELRAPGFKPHAFDADIVLDRSITYRAQLERDPDAPPPPAPIVTKPGSRTMYVVPGCYVGNVRPTQENLRPGCDISKLTTFEP